jgi:hypothetical protein
MLPKSLVDDENQRTAEADERLQSPGWRERCGKVKSGTVANSVCIALLAFVFYCDSVTRNVHSPLSDTCFTRNVSRVQRSCGCQVTTQVAPWQEQ